MVDYLWSIIWSDEIRSSRQYTVKLLLAARVKIRHVALLDILQYFYNTAYD